MLDNGSEDGTAEMLRGWAERLSGGTASLQVETLPVNVGAPAARNWLKRLPEVRAADWVAYLDDDALVPHDWLARFGQAVSLDPDAAVWGCRVCDETPPRVQSADLHLQAQPQAGDGVFDLNLEFVDTCGQDLDFGQLGYSRPCVSVTGCCHLFRGGTWPPARTSTCATPPRNTTTWTGTCNNFSRADTPSTTGNWA